jgi:octaprenyl-diphosphate synthase
LPLIFARERCNDQERELLDAAIRNGSVDDLGPILAIIEKTDSLNSAMAVANAQALEARQVIGILPDSAWRTALEQLADYSVSRDN